MQDRASTEDVLQKPGLGRAHLPAGYGRVRAATTLVPAVLLEPLIAEFCATCGLDWKGITRRKYRDDFARFLDWLADTSRPTTTAAFDVPTLAAYVAELRGRPKITGVWRGNPRRATALESQLGSPRLSANSVSSYVRPLRAFAGWLADEGLVLVDPFRRARRWSSRSPLLPSEDTPTKSATLDDVRALERGCAGDEPLDLRDRAIVALLVTTAARNSSVRLLQVSDVSFARSTIRFRRAKGDKTLELALQPSAAIALQLYLAHGRAALCEAGDDRGYLFPAHHGRGAPLSINALSLMLTRRYRAGGGTLPYFGSHRIRHGTATLLVNNGMALDEVSRYLGHSSTDVTRRYAIHTPEALGRRAAEALARVGLAG
jgi:site-specific recombinase XerD